MNDIIQVAEVEISYKTKVKPKDRIKITTSQNAYEALKRCYDPDKIEHIEQFYILLLNRSNSVLGFSKISQGGLSATIADIRLIFQIALKANAHSIILSHNHPSGNLKASQDDIAMTKQIAEAGKILDIKVLDHIIVTSESYLSLQDEGQMY
ncbi:MAG TPA: JAB domain-containing protein [Candidatus Wunengus sp. YC60]|uniref:JAB domain-containing protein n=1 Tax=Candidatus Wunengus sp. YC60 TaxID=3367697 RepID=UPI004025AC49